ncbi:Pre-mRNA-splicing factor [Lachnellula hyalina]|uniref:Pre-mRNA-splicing factor n=1 Tax=Lachnellula hyalina TaxID=1316788 RepID=A0A8H8U3Z3_9HELO|nr:Pre-mRNA-splicing factor [Lachnellula hyalina]TVY30793.1 Pre-mRNA-splicing factor [Lachnellula hyalina]
MTTGKGKRRATRPGISPASITSSYAAESQVWSYHNTSLGISWSNGLIYRKPGQGGDADNAPRDLRAELLQAEAVHFAKIKGQPIPELESEPATNTSKRQLENGGGEEEEDPEAKRRRVLEESRDVDADSEEEEEDSSEDDSDDDEDETAELQRELEKIKRERAEKREQEEREKAAAEEAEREHDIALGNPLLNPKSDFHVKRRWDDDVIFKNQARGTEDKGKKKEFVNVRTLPRASPGNYMLTSCLGSFEIGLS